MFAWAKPYAETPRLERMAFAKFVGGLDGWETWTIGVLKSTWLIETTTNEVNNNP
jgi:hypothetical protein